LFFLAIFIPELATALQARWAGVSRWWALLPVGILLGYRLLRANYEEFERLEHGLEEMGEALAREKEVPGPDVALVWDWTEDQRKTVKNIDLLTEKHILIHNRSEHYVYNVEIAPIRLQREMLFDKINEIAPGAKHLAIARWDGRSSETTNYIYFFDDNEMEEAGRRGWVHQKAHNRGISDCFLRIPMSVTYEWPVGTKWTRGYDFDYDQCVSGAFVAKSVGRA
jgi:hypothetical protein